MRLRWHRLPLAIAAIFCLLLLANPGIYCLPEDRESVSGDQVYAYTPLLWRQTSQADFQAGTLMMTDITASPGNVVLGMANNVAPTLYALAGGGTSLFYYFLVTANAWTRAPDAPGAVTDGGKLVSDGQRFIYAFQGGGSAALWRYDVYMGTWSSLANAPGGVSAGSDLLFGGSKIFALQGGGSSAVWTYTILTNTWSSFQLSGTMYGMSAGSSIAIAGGNLYAFRPATPYLMRAPKNGGAWGTTTSDVSQPTNPAGPGADMVATGGNAITVLFGGGTKLFRSYAPNQKTWTTLPNAPGAVSYGGGLAYQPANTILSAASYFALAGGGTKSFWRYTTSDSKWNTLSAIPSAVGAGGGLTYIYSSTSQYTTGGSYTSPTYDTGRSGDALNSIFWDASIPSVLNQDLFVQVRASDSLLNGEPDAPWAVVTGQTLVSGTATYYSSLSGYQGRYVQFSVDMGTVDVTTTPVLSEVRLYYRDA
jgi:hypothetical protein